MITILLQLIAVISALLVIAAVLLRSRQLLLQLKHRNQFKVRYGQLLIDIRKHSLEHNVLEEGDIGNWSREVYKKITEMKEMSDEMGMIGDDRLPLESLYKKLLDLNFDSMARKEAASLRKKTIDKTIEPSIEAPQATNIAPAPRGIIGAKMSVWVAKTFACIKVEGRANFIFSADFKTLMTQLIKNGYTRFTIDLSACVVIDSTFLGVLALFGVKCRDTKHFDKIILSNPNARITESFENLGVIQIFKIENGPLALPDDIKPYIPDTINPTEEQITRTSLEAHQALIAINPGNNKLYKEVTESLTEGMKRFNPN